LAVLALLAAVFFHTDFADQKQVIYFLKLPHGSFVDPFDLRETAPNQR
jgi:hypothetical protein